VLKGKYLSKINILIKKREKDKRRFDSLVSILQINQLQQVWKNKKYRLYVQHLLMKIKILKQPKMKSINTLIKL